MTSASRVFLLLFPLTKTAVVVLKLYNIVPHRGAVALFSCHCSYRTQCAQLASAVSLFCLFQGGSVPNRGCVSEFRKTSSDFQICKTKLFS